MIKKRDMVYLFELPQGYDYRFIEVDGIISIMGVHPEKKPIIVDHDGTVTEIDLEG